MTNNKTEGVEQRAKELYPDRIDADDFSYPGSALISLQRMAWQTGFIAGSESQGREAVEFAEWVSGNGWMYWENFPGTYLQEKEPVWIRDGYNEDQGEPSKLPTSHLLYQLFLKSKSPPPTSPE